MRRILCWGAAVALWGCQGTTTDPGEPLVCDDVAEGLWFASGPPFQMPMDTEVQFDAATCTFSTGPWSFMGMPMSHDSSMWGGVVDGDQVAVFGSTPFWDSCTAVLDQGGTHMAGACSEAPEGSDWIDLLLKE